MNTSIISYASAVISAIAIVFSWLSYRQERRKLSIEAITRNRIEWISNVRTLLGTFLSLYSEHPDDQAGKRVIMLKLALYMHRFDPSYCDLLDAIQDCASSSEYSADNASKVVSAAQVVFNRTWTRMKREAGIDKKQEDRLIAILNSECKAFAGFVCPQKSD